MLLGQAQTKVVLDHRGESHPWQAHQATPELGVEKTRGAHAELGKTGKVLGCGVQDPLDIAQDLIDG